MEYLFSRWRFVFIGGFLISFGFTSWYVEEYEPYDIVSDEWLNNPSFIKGVESWNVSRDTKLKYSDSEGVTLSSLASGKYISLYQRVMVAPNLEKSYFQREKKSGIEGVWH